jgi:hypothetical protein
MGFNFGQGLAAAGYATADIGLQGIKATLEEEKLKLADELAGKRDIGKEQRGIINRPLMDAAALPGAIALEKAKADIQVDTKRREPRTLSPGASEIVDGKIVVTAPDKTPPELLDYYKAHAESMRAGIGKGDKALLPDIKFEKDADGNVTLLDTRSGAIGTVNPAVANQPESGSLWWKKPAVPGKDKSISWSVNGETLPNGLNDLYPHMKGQGMGAQSNSGFVITRQDIDLIKSDPKRYAEASKIVGGDEILDGIVANFDKNKASDAAGGKASAEKKPDSPAAPPQAAKPQAPDIAGGPELDAARSRLSAASAKLRGYGLAQRQRDPTGYEAASKEFANAQEAAGKAQTAYEKSVGSTNSARIYPGP